MRVVLFAVRLAGDENSYMQLGGKGVLTKYLVSDTSTSKTEKEIV
jgi:hypothetical protein